MTRFDNVEIKNDCLVLTGTNGYNQEIVYTFFIENIQGLENNNGLEKLNARLINKTVNIYTNPRMLQHTDFTYKDGNSLFWQTFTDTEYTHRLATKDGDTDITAYRMEKRIRA